MTNTTGKSTSDMYEDLRKVSKKTLASQLQDAEKEIETLKQKSEELYNALQNSIRENIVQELSDEEVIALTQLKLLKEASMNRELTLEEVKKYDILHKNLSLINGKSTTIQGNSVSKNLSTKQLLSIAGSKVND